MTSKAEASLICKSFGRNGLPDKQPDVAVATLLKKRSGDATLTLAFTDASLRDPQSLKGVVLTAEKPLGCEHMGLGGEGVNGMGAAGPLAHPPHSSPLLPPTPPLRHLPTHHHHQRASRVRCPTSRSARMRWGG